MMLGSSAIWRCVDDWEGDSETGSGVSVPVTYSTTRLEEEGVWLTITINHCLLQINWT